MSQSNDTSLKTTDLFDHFADEHRQIVLAHLLEEDCVTVTSLVDHIVSTAHAIQSGDESAREHVHISLVHNHLPRLADHGLIIYDREHDTVEITSSGRDLLVDTLSGHLGPPESVNNIRATKY